MNNSNASVNISILEDMYRVANNYYYKGKLPSVHFEIGSMLGKKNSRIAYGVYNLPDGSNINEIKIKGSIISCLSMENVFKEILRNCYYLYAFINKIQISSRGGKYGDGNYRNESFLHYSHNKGIIVDKINDKRGYDIVSIDNTARELMKLNNWYIIPNRKESTYGIFNSNKHKDYLYVCDKCGWSFHATKDGGTVTHDVDGGKMRIVKYNGRYVS